MSNRSCATKIVVQSGEILFNFVGEHCFIFIRLWYILCIRIDSLVGRKSINVAMILSKISTI